jgi:ketosteroid isomerase-like protein
MDDDVEILTRIYDRFNARDMDAVLTVLADDVAWANGMDGVATSMAGRPYARTGRASGPWSVRTSSPWAFIALRMARSSQKSGSPSAISMANRSRGRRTG